MSDFFIYPPLTACYSFLVLAQVNETQVKTSILEEVVKNGIFACIALALAYIVMLMAKSINKEKDERIKRLEEKNDRLQTSLDDLLKEMARGR